MDIQELKKWAKNKIESDDLSKQVSKRIKETVWEKQNQREGFRESFKPLISQFEKPEDHKTKNIFTQNLEMLQNRLALTEGIAANQQAITQGLAGNRAAITQGLNQLGQIINQPQVEGAPQDVPEGQPPTYDESQQQQQQQQQIRQFNIERKFNENDFGTLNEYGYPRPSNFFRSNNENLQQILEEVTGEIRTLTGQINCRNRSLNPAQEYINETNRNEAQKETLQKYKNVINDYFRAINYQIGQGIRNPNQLINRLKLLGGSIMAGNNGVVPEFTQIAKYLNTIKVLPTKELNKMMKTMNIYLGMK